MEGKVPHPQEGDWGTARGHGLLPPGWSGGVSTATQGAEKLMSQVSCFNQNLKKINGALSVTDDLTRSGGLWRGWVGLHSLLQ